MRNLLGGRIDPEHETIRYGVGAWGRSLALAAVTALASLTFANQSAFAAGESAEYKEVKWSHTGPFGSFDRASVQRGLLVYMEVCAGCHSLDYVAFRSLQEIGLSEAEVKALAAGYEVPDVPNEDGDIELRTAKPSDKFPAPFDNDNAARASNGGALPPDLSLITKARADGENYVYSLLTGYDEPPADVPVGEGMNYNPYFPGAQLAMANPLSEDLVTYPDETPATVDQMSKDVVSFLAWAAEPTLEERKKLGRTVIMFLIIFAGVMYLVKRKVWSDLH